jgi:hypothetical protein
MAEMTIAQAQEIIGALLDVFEESILLCAANKVVLSIEGGLGWEARVEHMKELMAPQFAEVFLPLRKVLHSSSLARTSDTDWHQIVRTLLESVKDFDPTERGENGADST